METKDKYEKILKLAELAYNGSRGDIVSPHEYIAEIIIMLRRELGYKIPEEYRHWEHYFDKAEKGL
jgi:hypothetical protein